MTNDEAIRKLSNDLFGDDARIGPIYDGIVDTATYQRQEVKLMWVLKEAYDSFDEENIPYGGGWSISDVLAKAEPTPRGAQYNVAFTSYSIQNGFMPYDEIRTTVSQNSVFESLRGIAFVNLQKLPGPKNSNQKDIDAAYLKSKVLFLRQLISYNPDAVIFGCGYTFELIEKDLGISNEERVHCGRNLSYIPYGEKLIVWSDHPAVVRHKDYVDDISNLVRGWKESRYR